MFLKGPERASIIFPPLQNHFLLSPAPFIRYPGLMSKPDRLEEIFRMQQALNETQITGPVRNYLDGRFDEVADFMVNSDG